MILLIDNYDSFVHNLARYFERLGQTTRVVRNDAIEIEGVRQLAPQAIVLSPGPCTPDEAGCSLDLVRAFAGKIPLLGICLGHQAIAAALGGKIVRAPRPVHGRTSPVKHNRRGVFSGAPHPLQAARYHSLVVDAAAIPDELEVTAWTDDGLVMGVQHRSKPLVGLQFHPESILTEFGYGMLANFLELSGMAGADLRKSAIELLLPAAETSPFPRVPVTF